METMRFDFVVIGSGLAGTCAALLLSQLGEVALLSKEAAIKATHLQPKEALQHLSMLTIQLSGI